MELFGTAGIRGPVRSAVSPSLCVTLGRAAAEDGSAFVVGRDGRESGGALAAAIEAGLESGGADVVRLGQVPTPALAYASQGRRGVMVTASHNPPADNGLKFFDDGREYDRKAENRIESHVEAGLSPVEWDQWGDASRANVLEEYRRIVVDYVSDETGRCPSIHVAVDCGNGMSSLVTPQVLRELGATVTTLNASIDGHFPGRGSKPTAETLGDLRGLIDEGPFDLGFAHDGDGDRIVVLDADGEVVHEDTVLTIVAGHYVETSETPDPVVLTTPNASERIDEHVTASGGRTERVPLGSLHEGIADLGRSKEADPAVVFAAEPWKHLHPQFGHWIDATVSAGLLASLVANSGLTDLRAPIQERPYRKVSVDCPNDKKSRTMSVLETRLPSAFPDADIETEYGIRLSLPEGSWALVRPSGTEPCIRIYAESEDVDELIDRVIDVVKRAIEKG